MWELSSGRCERVLEGHKYGVNSVAWSADGLRALSGSEDNTVRVWELSSGRCERVLEGHTSRLRSAAWSADGRFAFSAADNGEIRVWGVSGTALAAGPGTQQRDDLPAASALPLSQDDDQTQYTNAKVLLVGDSSAGKTGLSFVLAGKEWEPSGGSTVGAWATQWNLPVVSTDGVQREIWLWDFGGQADQRLIHQLYMDQTALAVLVFDGGKTNLFETLGQWDRDLAKASSREFVKLLAAGRVDASVVRVDRDQLREFARMRGFRGDVIQTSAKEGTGCEELKQAIYDAIPWHDIPCRTTLTIFKRLKDEIVRLRDDGRVLMRFNELRDALTLRLSGIGFQPVEESVSGTALAAGSGEAQRGVLPAASALPLTNRKAERQAGSLSHATRFTDEQLSAVLTLLSGPGVVWELSFGSWVLLQPERINACAQAVIQTMSSDPHGLGCISEEQVLSGELKYSSDVTPLPPDEERIVRMAMHATLIDRNLCWREADPNHKTLLVFPSYYRRERDELTRDPAVFVSYQFNGFLDDIYATLVVRLHHTPAFEKDQLWNYAADFKTQTGQQLGVKLTRRAEGAGELDVYFDPAISTDTKLLFARFVHEHLKLKANDIVRLRHYVCPVCHTPVRDRETAMKKLAEGKKFVFCLECEKKCVPLWDELEDRFASDDLREAVRLQAEQGDFAKSNESKERALVGEVISAVALAGQLSREITVSDKGLDMEIEFNDDAGDATGQRLYLQLKSGDSQLTIRKRDGAEVFQIKDQRHVSYWMNQAFPVLLVVRNSAGEVRWMEVRDWLREATDNGKKKVTQIVFEGERFDVMSIRRWRERLLG